MSGAEKKVVDLTIVVPCLDEEENIIDILDKIAALVGQLTFSCEIVVVDDQSSDRTAALAEGWAEHSSVPTTVLRRPLDRRGYGAVVRYGVAHGSGRYCIFVSADSVDPIHLIPQLYEKLEEGHVLAQCSRYLNPGDDHTIPFKYKFFQFFFRAAVVVALGKYIPDSTYAFKMFRRSELLAVGLTQNRFSISAEITFKAILMRDDVAYIPGAQGTRARGVSKFHFRKEGFGFGYCLMRAFLHRLRLIYWF